MLSPPPIDLALLLPRHSIQTMLASSDRMCPLIPAISPPCPGPCQGCSPAVAAYVPFIPPYPPLVPSLPRSTSRSFTSSGRMRSASFRAPGSSRHSFLVRTRSSLAGGLGGGGGRASAGVSSVVGGGGGGGGGTGQGLRRGALERKHSSGMIVLGGGGDGGMVTGLKGGRKYNLSYAFRSGSDWLGELCGIWGGSVAIWIH